MGVTQNGRQVNVKTVVMNQRKENPNCQIAYHTMTEVVDDTLGSFSLSLEHGIAFVPTCGLFHVAPEDGAPALGAEPAQSQHT